jgi:hypothetical protein
MEVAPVPDKTVIDPTRRGRPPGKPERPDIVLPNGVTLKPRKRLAAQFGMSERTLVRLGVETTLVAGVSYASEQSVLRIIADGLRAPKRRRRR